MLSVFYLKTCTHRIRLVRTKHLRASERRAEPAREVAGLVDAVAPALVHHEEARVAEEAADRVEVAHVAQREDGDR